MTTPAPTGAACGSLQALVDAALAGSVVTAPPCTYRETVTINKPLTLRGYGSVISGKDAAGTTVRSAWMVVNASDVTVEGFSMHHASNAAQTGAMKVKAGVSHFTLRACDLAHAAGANVFVGGRDSLIEDCDIHHAGQLGIALSGGAGSWNNVVRDNRIYANNTAGFDPEWEAGGVKATEQTRLRLEDNEVYANAGPGLWCDMGCRDIVVAGNRVHHNSHAGIFFEISDGATIRGNAVWENGWGKADWGWGAGILVSSSRNADVSDNVVAWNYAGISVVSQDRADNPGPIIGNWVHDNTVAAEPGQRLAGFYQDWAGVLYTAARNNRGAANRYWMPVDENGTARFEWSDSLGSLSDYNATPGDEEGRYLSAAEMDALLAAAGVAVGAAGRVASDGPSGTVVAAVLAVTLGVAAAGALTALLLVRRAREGER